MSKIVHLPYEEKSKALRGTNRNSTSNEERLYETLEISQ